MAIRKGRQELREQDLARYGIQTIFVDDYTEITEILKEVELSVLANNVFISSSLDIYSTKWTKARVEDLAWRLANQLVKAGFRLTSGFGRGTASAVINGALDDIYANRYKHIDEHLCLRPFPQGITDENERKMMWKKYREEILYENGAAIIYVWKQEKW